MGILGKNGVNTDTLTQQELNYLLSAISEMKFNGKDVLLLGTIVEKLSNQLNAK